MSAEHNDILRKVRACLALAESPEQHEAAAALRQAEALMRRHGLSEADIEIAAVQERDVTVGRAVHLPPYLRALARMVADVMGCDIYSPRPRTVAFVGVAPSAEIAAYSYEVLARQLLRARAEHRKRRTRGAEHKRTERADAWAYGWVAGVRCFVEAIRPPVPAAVSKYMAERHADLMRPKVRKVTVDEHAIDGFIEGRSSGVHLHRGMASGEEPRRLPGVGEAGSNQ